MSYKCKRTLPAEPVILISVFYALLSPRIEKLYYKIPIYSLYNFPFRSYVQPPCSEYDICLRIFASFGQVNADNLITLNIYVGFKEIRCDDVNWIQIVISFRCPQRDSYFN